MLYEYDGDATLSMKIFSAEGGREDCCVKRAAAATAAAPTMRMRTKTRKAHPKSRSRKARLLGEVRGSPEMAAPKISLTSFFVASSTYFWK